jgi:hypothetical protein
MDKKEYLRLDRFTSKSELIDVAFNVMFKGLKMEEVPVLNHITGMDQDGLFYFKLDSKYYAKFSNEKEVLIINCNIFIIFGIKEEVHHNGTKYHLV